jgi:hypothetical protein
VGIINYGSTATKREVLKRPGWWLFPGTLWLFSNTLLAWTPFGSATLVRQVKLALKFLFCSSVSIINSPYRAHCWVTIHPRNTNPTN